MMKDTRWLLKFGLFLYLMIGVTPSSDRVVDRNDWDVSQEIQDLNKKLKKSESILKNLLKSERVQRSLDVKEHVEKMLDWMKFRREALNEWQLTRHQFESLRTGINRDYAVLPEKIEYILSHDLMDKRNLARWINQNPVYGKNSI